MKIFGAQSQRVDGILDAIGKSQPAVWKVIDADDAIFGAIKRVSSSTTTIHRVYTGQPTIDDASQHPDSEAYGVEYATLVFSKTKTPQYVDFIESPNEPVDHYGDLTEFIKRVNAFLVGFSRRAKELGFKPLGPNFSTGYPEVYIQGSDYVLWPNAWQGLTDGLRSLQSCGGALSIHEYDSPDLFRLWSDAKQLGYLVGRHKAIYRSLPADLQTLPLYLTEFGIDWLTQGVEGGFWLNRDDQAFQFMIDQAKQSYARIYSTTPQLRGICFFLWGSTDSHFDNYDIRKTDNSITAFTKFFSEELTGGIITPVFHFTHYPLPKLHPVTQPFGVNPDYYKQFGLPAHEGTDFGCPVGTPVLSVADGKVSSISSVGNYGLHVTVDYPDSHQVIYCHLSRSDVHLNDLVPSGASLGLSGASGNVTGPHLHLTYKWLGHPYLNWPSDIQDPTQELLSVTPQGDNVSTAQERINAAWGSEGVVFNPIAAFPKKALALGIGRAVANEYEYVAKDGKIMAGQCFNLAFLETEKGQFGLDQIKAYDYLTGEAYVATATQPPASGGVQVYAFPQTLTDYGANGVEGVPATGLPFYRLTGATVSQGVSANANVVVFGKGAPAIGVQVVSLRPDGKGEVLQTAGDGSVQFNFGAASAFTSPGQGPFSIFVASGAVKDGDSKLVTWKAILSDKVQSLGDYQGLHSEFKLQFVQQ